MEKSENVLKLIDKIIKHCEKGFKNGFFFIYFEEKKNSKKKNRIYLTYS